MASIEIHQLRYFVEVAQTGSFTQAARRCNVTQPTLSHQIKKLEVSLGEPLLHRRRRGAKTTAFGRRFFRRAIAVLGEIEAAKEDAASFKDEIRGELKLGVIPTIAPYLMPRIIAAVREGCPLVEFEVTEDTTSNLVESMRMGDVDIALLSLPLEGDEWEAIPLLEDEILVILPQGHRLSREVDVPLDSLRGERVILMKEAHCLTGQSLAICNRFGVSEDISFQSSQIDTLVSMVEAGLGVSFVPAMSFPRLKTRAVETRSVGDKPVYRSIALVYPRQSARTRALTSFVQVCRDTIKT